MNSTDQQYMQLAYEQAQLAIGISSPNPRVGCVIVLNQSIVGRGHTQIAGQAHAEVMAIRSANTDLSGCTVYVTLEPCCHFGRTPPCVDALKAIFPKRVVVACLDANPQVTGHGVEALRAMGIEVEVLAEDNPLAIQAFELNIGFMQRMKQHRAYTRLKWASTMDGKTALPDGKSQWITTPAAREDGHRFRARADVIVTGIGTVLHDDPQLNVRTQTVARPLVKCVLDTHLRTPLNAQLFQDGSPVVLAYAHLVDDTEQADRIATLSNAHPQLQLLALNTIDTQLDLAQLWTWFFEQQFNEVHVEAGAKLNAALLNANLVDELLMYIAPRVMGDGLLSTQFTQNKILDDLQHHAQWKWLESYTVGDDLCLRARKLMRG